MTPKPETTADGSKTLYSSHYAQTYHSTRGALAEAGHVFLAGAGVQARLEAGEATRVLEVGFGTGLNFLLSADLALQREAPLCYVALERSLLEVSVLRDLAYGSHLRTPGLWQELLAWRALLPKLPQGLYSARFGPVTLELLLGEAGAQVLPQTVDAVYLDAFSPDANPELWTEGFLGKLHGSLREGGCLSTYSVKGEVRRRLAALGFRVQKRPGPPGGKREMLVAVK